MALGFASFNKEIKVWYHSIPNAFALGDSIFLVNSMGDKFLMFSSLLCLIYSIFEHELLTTCSNRFADAAFMCGGVPCVDYLTHLDTCVPREACWVFIHHGAVECRNNL